MKSYSLHDTAAFGVFTFVVGAVLGTLLAALALGCGRPVEGGGGETESPTATEVGSGESQGPAGGPLRPLPPSPPDRSPTQGPTGKDTESDGSSDDPEKSNTASVDGAEATTDVASGTTDVASGTTDVASGTETGCIGDAPPYAACACEDECRSGHCVDGLCSLPCRSAAGCPHTETGPARCVAGWCVP